MKIKLTLLIVLISILVVACSHKAPKPFGIISYNVWNGFEGEEQRQALFVEWAKKQDVDVIAFQELNGYTQDSLAALAQLWGHPHAIIVKEEGYPVAISSKYPINTIAKVMEQMHHGYLLVTTGNIRLCVIHFSPFSSVKRFEETKTVLRKLIDVPQKDLLGTVILGDFNAYTASDSIFYNASNRIAVLQRNDSIHEVHQNLNINGKIDYDVLDLFQKSGYCDAHDVLHLPFEHSYPTHVFDGPPTDQEKERLDHILLSPELQPKLISEEIIKDDVTNMLSDHYPIKIILNPNHIN